MSSFWYLVSLLGFVTALSEQSHAAAELDNKFTEIHDAAHAKGAHLDPAQRAKIMYELQKLENLKVAIPAKKPAEQTLPQEKPAEAKDAAKQAPEFHAVAEAAIQEALDLQKQPVSTGTKEEGEDAEKDAEKSPKEEDVADGKEKDEDGAPVDDAPGPEPKEDVGELEVMHQTAQEAVASEPSTGTLMQLPLLAALLSFAGIMSYTLVFIFNIFKRSKKLPATVPSKAKAASSQKMVSEDLDFEDLEGASDFALPSTGGHDAPVVRKMVQTHEETAEACADGWDNDMESNAGWGDNNWEEDDWDETPDSEGAALPSSHQVDYEEVCVVRPVVKGKAD